MRVVSQGKERRLLVRQVARSEVPGYDARGDSPAGISNGPGSSTAIGGRPVRDARHEFVRRSLPLSHDEIAKLAESGWNACASIREGLERAGLPVPTAEYLRKTFKAAQWDRALRATQALREHFKDASFADQATFGVLLVPDLNKLDTRGALDETIRRGQMPGGSADFVDRRLPAGKIAVKGGRDWSLVATITGTAGIFLGSYNEIIQGPADSFSVQGIDTRTLMVRQIWGARVLQCGTTLPDSSDRDTWTFTLFPGEELTDGNAASGTILHGKVRFRLGQTHRRISSVRVCPALVIT